MTTVVIMPGGFHPFHAGHMALYNSARRVFPDAEVFVAATDDTSTRPFPFAVKEKLAQLAGVEPGHFVRVKSPFQAVEITSKFDPAKDQLIFVRSEKDQGQPPVPGRVKKDGTPGYLQPLLGAKKLEPFARHAYMAYLPTVEFGPGFKSATEIRNSWPQLDERQKTALVMSLYPRTQSNPKLAATVRKMLDTAIVGDTAQELAEGLGDYITKKIDDFLDMPKISPDQVSRLMKQAPQKLPDDVADQLVARFMETERAKRLAQQAADAKKTTVEKIVPYLTYFGRMFVDRWNRIPQRDRDNALKNLVYNIGRFFLFILEAIVKGATKKEDVEENQGWAATFTAEQDRQCAGGDPGGGMIASYQKRENQPVAEKKESGKARDAELIQALQYIKQHYPNYAGDAEMAMAKWLQRSIKHSEINDVKHDKALSMLNSKIDALAKIVKAQKAQQMEDYVEEGRKK